jgi:hypothetical protein
MGSSPELSDGESLVALIRATADSAPGSGDDAAGPPEAGGGTELFPRLAPFSSARFPLWTGDRETTESLAEDPAG